VAVTIYGVDPSISELEWSVLHEIADKGGWSEVVDDADGALVPSAGGGTRQTVIAAGDCVASGVLGRNSAPVTVTHDANTSSAPAVNRLDYVVFRINWAGSNTTGGTIAIVKGSTSSGLAPALTKVAGTTWEIPLALVTIVPNATVLNAADVVDVRPKRRYSRRYKTNPAGGQSVGAGTSSPSNIATINVDDPGWPYRLRVTAMIKFVDLVGAGFGRLDLNVDGGASEAEGRAPDRNKGVATIYWVGPVRSGPATVRLRMMPSSDMAGEPLVTASAYRDFTVEVEPA
jgi:hypothetical protein